MPAPATQESLAAPQAAPRYGLAALILANAMLALGPLFVRLADTGPVASAFWRMAIALPLIALMAVAVKHKPQPFSRGVIIVIAASGVLFALDLASWHLGIVRTKMANATLFGNSASLIFPIYGFLVARAWPSRPQTFALLLAGAGGAILMGRSAQFSPEHLTGDLLSFLAGVFYAAYFVAIARARETLSPLPLLAASTLASGIPLLAMAWALNEQILPTDWTPLVLLAIGSQVIGQGLMVYALGAMSPLIVGLALLTQPVVAAIIGWAVYGEGLGPLDFVGALMVGLALVLVRQPARAVSLPAQPAA